MSFKFFLCNARAFSFLKKQAGSELLT